MEYTALEVIGNVVSYTFWGIFTVYGLFLIILTICLCHKKDIYKFIYVFVFKCISLSLAFAIFATVINFEFNTMRRYFSKEAIKENPLMSIILLISFEDICLDMLSLIVKFGGVLVQLRSKSFKEIMCSVPPEKTCCIHSSPENSDEEPETSGHTVQTCTVYHVPDA